MSDVLVEILMIGSEIPEAVILKNSSPVVVKGSRIYVKKYQNVKNINHVHGDKMHLFSENVQSTPCQLYLILIMHFIFCLKSFLFFSKIVLVLILIDCIKSGFISKFKS